MNAGLVLAIVFVLLQRPDGNLLVAVFATVAAVPLVFWYSLRRRVAAARRDHRR